MEHFHHIVVLGIKSNGYWDVIHLEKVRTSSGAEHIEEDLRQIIQILYRYEPDIILPDLGYNGNYVARLIGQFGTDKVFGVMQRTAKSNGDMNAHFNEQGNTVTIDKLMQNMSLISEIKAGRIGFIRNLDDPELQLLIKHGQNVVIKDEQDENSGAIYKTITRKGGDYKKMVSL